MSAGKELRRIVDEAYLQLLNVSEEASLKRPADGKWSRREVIGHLIDSASNNHQRFVRAQLREEHVFEGYDQEAWVRSQNYHDAPWCEVVELWYLYNAHLARVIDAVPDEIRHARRRNNFSDIAFSPAPQEGATLDWFMRDYVVHLEHHLRQAIDGYVPQWGG